MHFVATKFGCWIKNSDDYHNYCFYTRVEFKSWKDETNAEGVSELGN